METKFNFNSAICTSRVQSERLLALGLKKETADMWRGYLVGGETIVPTEEVDLYNFYAEPIPAWSLHRLIELCRIEGSGATLELVSLDQTYDKYIGNIRYLIKKGLFNKEYLV